MSQPQRLAWRTRNCSPGEGARGVLGARRPEGTSSAPGRQAERLQLQGGHPTSAQPPPGHLSCLPAPSAPGLRAPAVPRACLTAAGGRLTPKPSLSHLSFPVSRGEGQGPPAGWAWLLRWVTWMPGRLGREGKRRPRPLRDWAAGPGPGREERLPPVALAGVCGGVVSAFQKTWWGGLCWEVQEPVDAPTRGRKARGLTPRGSGSPRLP